MISMWKEGYFDYNFSEACNYYGGCFLKDRCSADEPDLWDNNYFERTWNPLHKKPELVQIPAPNKES